MMIDDKWVDASSTEGRGKGEGVREEEMAWRWNIRLKVSHVMAVLAAWASWLCRMAGPDVNGNSRPPSLAPSTYS